MTWYATWTIISTVDIPPDLSSLHIILGVVFFSYTENKWGEDKAA